MKKHIFVWSCTLALVCALLMVPAAAAGFSDVPDSHWASAYIELLSGSKVIEGFPDGTFAPESTVSRAQFLALTARTLSNGQLRAAGEGEQWWTPAYEYAAEHLLITEARLPASVAVLNAPITRYEAADILARSCTDTSGIKVSEVFRDVKSEYGDSVRTAARTGLLVGYSDNTFGGDSTLTRAEAATIITRLQARAGIPEGFHFITSWGDHWLLQNYDREGTELRLIDILTGRTLDSVQLNMDMPAPGTDELPAESADDEAALDMVYTYTNRYLTLTQCSGDLVWGEAGLYQYQNGRLKQLYDSGVCAVAEDNGGYLLVTHEKGQRVLFTSGGVNLSAGNQVVQIDAKGNATVLLDASGLGLNLTNVFRRDDDSVYVDASENGGMAAPDVYLYQISNGRLLACATAGGNGYSARTEEEAKAEQARLDKK